MSQSTLRREKFRVRSLSAPATSVTAMKRSWVENNIEMKLILESALTSQDKHFLISANKACAEVGQELSELSGLIEKEWQRENWTFIENIYSAIQNQDADALREAFFEALDDMITGQVCTKIFVNFTVFSIILARFYEQDSSNCSTNGVINLVAKLMTLAYERYHINEWIQEQGGWTGVLKLVRNQYQTFVDGCVLIPRGLGSWRQIAMAGGVTIGAIAVGAGIWYFR